MKISKKILRRQLCQSYKSFADDLHQKLERYGVEYHICERITRLRMLYAINHYHFRMKGCDCLIK